jgi:hypothetical protein
MSLDTLVKYGQDLLAADKLAEDRRLHAAFEYRNAVIRQALPTHVWEALGFTDTRFPVGRTIELTDGVKLIFSANLITSLSASVPLGVVLVRFAHPGKTYTLPGLKTTEPCHNEKRVAKWLATILEDAA